MLEIVDGLPTDTKKIVLRSGLEMATLQHGWIRRIHLFLSFALMSSTVQDILLRHNVSAEAVRKLAKLEYEQVPGVQVVEKYSDEVKSLIASASEWAKDDGEGHRGPTRPDHLFIRLLESEDEVLERVLRSLGYDIDAMKDEAMRVRATLDRANANVF